jgi:hypothetical protein
MLVFPEHYYYTLRPLRDRAIEIYPHPKLLEAAGYEDVARAILYTFDDENRRKLSRALGFTCPDQFEVYLMIMVAVARLERQVIEGGWPQ